MKPILLEIEGFNSFEKKQVIDFEKLTSLGLFGIFGNTGSGKTTILDAIIYALYEKTPRSSDEIVNINCKKVSVKYIFSIKGSNAGTYEVQRSVSVGKTISKKAKITKLDDDEVIASDKKTEVDKKIEEIIGLSYQDFIKTVVLPQGEFSSFLKEKNKNRKEMLERLFSLQKYGDELEKKMRLYKAKYEEIQKDYNKEISSYELTDENSIDNLQKELQNIEKNIENLQKEYKILEELSKEYILLKNLENEYKIALENYNETVKYSAKMQDIREKVEKLSKLTVLQETIKIYEKSVMQMPILQKELNNLHENIKKLQQEKNEKVKIKEQLSAEIETIPEIQKNIEEIEKAVVIKKNIVNLQKQKEETSQKIDNLEKSKNEKNEKIFENKMKITDINEKLQNIEKIIEAHTYKSEYKENVRLGASSVSMYDKLTDDISKLEQELEQNTNIKNKKDIIINEKIKLIEKINEQISSLKTKIADDDYTLELYEKNDSMLVFMQNVKNNLLQNEKNLIDTEKELQSSMKNQKKLLEEKGIVLEQIKKLEEISRKKQRENLIALVVKDMHDGDECPVCHGVYHAKHNHEYTDMSIDDSKLEENKKMLSQIEQNLAIMQNNVDRMKNAKKDIISSIEQIKKESNMQDISGIDAVIAQCEKYKKSYSEHTKQKEKITSEISTYEQNLNKEKTELEVEKANIKSLLDSINVTQDKINELKENAQKTLEQINIISEKLSIKKEDFANSLTQIISSEKIIEENTIELNQKKENIRILELQKQKLEEDEKNISEELNYAKLNLQKIDSEILFEHGKISDISLIEKQNLEQILQQNKNNIEETKENYKNINEELEKIEKMFMQNNIEQAKLDTNYTLCIEQLNNSSQKIKEFATKNGFSSVNDVFELNKEYEQLEKKKASVENFDRTLKEHELKKELSKEKYEKQLENLAKLEEQQKYDEEKHIQLKQIIEEKQRLYGSISNKLEREKEIFDKKKDLIIRKSENQKVLDEISQIEQLLKGKALVQFLAKHQLSYVCKKSSELLENISAGRFNIDIDDDGEFIILDYKNGGVRRNPSTLSGGETFLVSLSLALALSSQIQLRGNAPLEFFFMDEGFGTLDSETLDVALDCLRKIKNENLSIGIISHIDKIKQAVPVKLEIKKDDVLGTASTVKIVTG